MQHQLTMKLKALAAAFAVAALAAPVTQAAIQTDARHQALVDKAPQVQVDPQHSILLMHRHAGELNYTTHTVVSGPTQQVSGDGMDWADAGIGAGAALGAILLGTGVALVSRKKLVSA